MPVVKQTPNLRRSLMLRIGPILAAMVAIFWFSDRLPASIRLPAEFIALLLCALGVALISVRLAGRFTCPDCGTFIGHHMPTGGVPGAPLKYHCTHCDVIWETGLTAVDD